MTECLLIDVSAAGLVRFGLGERENSGVTETLDFDVAQHPTFTNAVYTYLRRVDRDPRELSCVLAAGGPPVTDIVPFARSRWTISRQGLSNVFYGRARVINDVAAVAWALSLAERPSITSLFGTVPNFRTAGRWLMVTLEPDGVGTATINTDGKGHTFVGETESGAAGFAARTAEEFDAAQRLRALNGHVSWEQVLCSTSSRSGGAWPGLVGDFVGDAMLATGSWSGAIVAGRSSHALLRPEASVAFRERLIKKQKCGRYLALSSLSLIGRMDVLVGCRRYAEANGLLGNPASSLERP